MGWRLWIVLLAATVACKAPSDPKYLKEGDDPGECMNRIDDDGDWLMDCDDPDCMYIAPCGEDPDTGDSGDSGDSGDTGDSGDSGG